MKMRSNLHFIIVCNKVNIDLLISVVVRRKDMKYDVIIIGAGPAGIFTALEMVKNKCDKKILIVEKGCSISKRRCPKTKQRNV